MIKIVAFDLDGTLLKGNSVCAMLAHRVGQDKRMREIEKIRDSKEIEEALKEMVQWYKPYSIEELCDYLKDAQYATGLQEGLSLLKTYNIKTALISMTWDFAVEWFAKKLMIDYYAGTKFSRNDKIILLNPTEKANWILNLINSLGYSLDELVVVGDSWGDFEMFNVAKHRFFVGESLPTEINQIIHISNGDIREISKWVLKFNNI